MSIGWGTSCLYHSPNHIHPRMLLLCGLGQEWVCPCCSVKDKGTFPAPQIVRGILVHRESLSSRPNDNFPQGKCILIYKWEFKWPYLSITSVLTVGFSKYINLCLSRMKYLFWNFCYKQEEWMIRQRKLWMVKGTNQLICRCLVQISDLNEVSGHHFMKLESKKLWDYVEGGKESAYLFNWHWTVSLLQQS